MENIKTIASLCSSRSNYPLLGLSVKDPLTKTINCYEFIDNHFFDEMAKKISKLKINVLLVLKEQKEFFKQKFNHEVNIIELKRTDFNIDYANFLINEIKIKNPSFVHESLTYFMLGSIGGLISYLKTEIENIVLYLDDNRMYLNERTITALNLIGNNSLYKKIKSTYTKMGAEELFKNILQPLIDLNEIKERQKFVKFLINNEKIAVEIGNLLKNFPNTNSIYNKFNAYETFEPEKLIVLVFEIFSFLHLAISFSNLIHTNKISEFSFIREISILLKEQNLKKHYEKISILTENKFYNGKFIFNVFDLVEMFKINDELLNILKQMYNENLEDLHAMIYEIFGDTSELYYDKKHKFIIRTKDESLISILIKNYDRNKCKDSSSSKGTTEKSKKNSIKKRNISKKLTKDPHNLTNKSNSVFNNQTNNSSINLKNIIPLFLHKNKDYFYFTIINFEQFSLRAEDALGKIIRIYGRYAIEIIKDFYSCVWNIREIGNKIGLIDMLHSFYLFSQKHDCTLPIFEDSVIFNDSTNILVHKGEVKSNDVYSSSMLNFSIITGDNCGGKTCYLRMIGMNVILSQMGCVLPCRFAKTKIFKSIFTRIGEHPNHNEISSFGNELLDCKFILEQSNKDSLILIDELGSHTNYSDGFTLLLTMSTLLLKKESYVFLVTHFKEIIFYLQENKRISFLQMINYKIKAGINEKSNSIELIEKLLPKEYTEDILIYIKIFKEKEFIKVNNISFNLLATKILACENEVKRNQLREKLNKLIK